MALISCPDCGRQVSDQAVACPQCARPFVSSGHQHKKPVVIEETGKEWKAMQFLGGAGVCLSIVACVATAGAESASIFPGLMFLASSALYAVGRFGAWWNHR